MSVLKITQNKRNIFKHIYYFNEEKTKIFQFPEAHCTYHMFAFYTHSRMQ